MYLCGFSYRFCIRLLFWFTSIVFLMGKPLLPKIYSTYGRCCIVLNIREIIWLDSKNKIKAIESPRVTKSIWKLSNFYTSHTNSFLKGKYGHWIYGMGKKYLKSQKLYDKDKKEEWKTAFYRIHCALVIFLFNLFFELVCLELN